jgi:predicted ATPase/DNA-binding SARP family transcriptional activator
MPDVQLRCYGGFSLEVDGQPLLLPTVKIRVLLIYLLFGPQRRYARRSLAALFWPEAAESRGLANLSTALSLLRSRLPAGTLEYDADSRTVALAHTAIHSDHAEIAALQARIEAHPHRAAERCPTCNELIARAVDLMHGTWLDGIELWECETLQYWLTVEQEQQRRQYINLVRVLMQQYSRLGRYSEVIRLAEQSLAQDPWQEEVLAILLRAHLAHGSRIAGLTRYRRFTEELQREFGIEPAEPLQAAADALRRSKSALESVKPLPPAPAAVTLFGRRQELAQLSDWLVRSDRRLVTISGLGGVGKTTLALAAAARLAPWLQDGAWIARLDGIKAEADALIEIGRVLGVTFSAGSPPIERLVERLAGRELLLVLDNVEQLPVANRICATLLQRTEQVNLLVTSRRPLRLWQEQILALQGFAVGDPDGDDDAALQLFTARVERMFGGGLLPTPVEMRAICAAVGGLPLAIELAAAQLREQTAAQLIDRLQHDSAQLFSPAADLPERQRRPAAILAQAYADLSAAESAALISLSVHIGSFDRRTLPAAVADQLPDDRMIALLAERGLLVERGTRRELHPLVRRYVQQQAPAAQINAARRRHRDDWLALVRTADLRVIDQQRRQRVQELGPHYGNLRSAWLQAAADDATPLDLIDALVILLTCQGWFTAGAELFEQSAQLLPAGETAARCLLAAARLWQQAGEFPRILPLIRRARRLYPTARTTAESAGIRAKALIEEGRYRRAERLTILGLPLCPPDDTALRARLQYTRARALLWQGRLSDAEQQYRLVLASARAMENHGLAIDCLNALAQIPARNGDLAASLPLLEAAMIETEQHGDPQAQITALVNVGAVRAVLQQEPATATALLDRALELARRVGNRRDIVSVLHSAAYGLIHLAQLPRAAQLLEESLALALQIRHAAFVLEQIEGFGLLAVHQGEREHAQYLLTAVVGHAQTSPFVRQRARQALTRYGLAETAAEPPADPFEFGQHLLAARRALP